MYNSNLLIDLGLVNVKIDTVNNEENRFKINNLIEQTEYLSGGELKKWPGPYQQVFSSILLDNTEDPHLLGSYPLMDEIASSNVLDDAISAYKNGTGYWPTLMPKERVLYMKKFLSEFKKTKEEIITLLMWEIGKSLEDSIKEFDRTVLYIEETIDFYKNKSRKLAKFYKNEEVYSRIGDTPRGIVLCMGPYNYPLNETFTTLIPALITGNIVIFKPPKMGVLLHRPLLKIFKDVFPKGVVGTVYGEGQKVISPLISSGKVDVLAFIGSSRVADILKNQHPKPHRLHCVMGLEAKNPAIIFGDANINNAIDECLKGTLSYNGQRCTALKILFVQKSISNEFVKKFAESVDQLKVGNPWDKGVQITPLPELSKITYLNELVDDAKNFGAKIINTRGGKIGPTLFFPLVLYPVDINSRIAKEEQFGPLVPIVEFEKIEEVLNYVVYSNYGQQLSIFSSNEKNINQVVHLFSNQVSRININCQCQRGPDNLPFTGRKDSAVGTLSVRESIRAFTIEFVLAIPKNKFKKFRLK